MPHTIICDNPKEINQGEFNRKHKEASCHLRQTEPFTPWLNAAERKIKELKNGSARKMIKSSALKGLWDSCLELESNIRSNTAYYKHKLDGEFLQQLFL